MSEAQDESHFDRSGGLRLRPWQVALLAVVLIGPRAARMAAPRVWLEDTPYAYAGFLITQGLQPHVDFVCPHFPFLEAGLAIAYELFGAGHRTAEALTHLATFLAALLVFLLARRAWRDMHQDGRDGFWPGLIASAIFGACALTFRYHLFEREVFLNVLLLLSGWLALRKPDLSRGRAGAIGLLLGVGFVVKLTFVVYAGALCAYLLWIAKRRQAMLIALATMAGLVVAATLICYALYRDDFLFQVFAFHWFKGRNFMRLVDKLNAARDWCSLPIGAAVIALVWATQLRSRVAYWAWAVLAVYVVYLVFLSPTLWAHNMLMLLPGLSILGGLGVAHSLAADRRATPRALAAWVAAAAMLLWVTPLRNRNWRPEGAWGFAGIRRADLRDAAAFIRRSTRPSDPIVAPPIVALEANRIDPYHYRELLGVCRWARASVHKHGWRDTRLIGACAPLAAIELDSRSYWLPLLFQDIRRGAFAAVAPDNRFTHFDMLRSHDLAPDLMRAGYAVAHQAGPIEVWMREDRGQRSEVRGQ